MEAVFRNGFSQHLSTHNPNGNTGKISGKNPAPFFCDPNARPGTETLGNEWISDGIFTPLSLRVPPTFPTYFPPIPKLERHLCKPYRYSTCFHNDISNPSPNQRDPTHTDSSNSLRYTLMLVSFDEIIPIAHYAISSRAHQPDQKLRPPEIQKL
ncbi:unnamed protein product [Rotaria magnacalcarata]|uniref:Uncharacterized protein n=1 Tax=Rotaria magnacalcarata TaxID=392030 RepID=A0A816S1B5_9BILA|nr:unnamed protein product [Rotaria magnacalcarata]CAF3892606.1 unnamed protein product [Rotaria magnacalcarata]CAF4007123.1 unnamed protein product [Rotaria magnacalcarata]